MFTKDFWIMKLKGYEGKEERKGKRGRRQKKDIWHFWLFLNKHPRVQESHLNKQNQGGWINLWTISFALGPCVLTSFESGAGLCLAESEIEIHPSTTCCEAIFTGFTGGLTLMQNFEVSGSRLGLQRSKSPCTKWPLATKGVGGRRSSACVVGSGAWTETSAWARCRI